VRHAPSDDDTLATEVVRRSARQQAPAPRRAPPPRAFDKPVWWRPYLDDTDKQVLAFAAPFALGGVAALLGFALRWAWLQP
jgi:hypothetical protein